MGPFNHSRIEFFIRSLTDRAHPRTKKDPRSTPTAGNKLEDEATHFGLIAVLLAPVE